MGSKALRTRIKTVDLLRFAKRHHKYADLSKITGLDIPTLNRYVKGVLLPHMSRSRKIIEALEKEVKSEILTQIRPQGIGFSENLPALRDAFILRILAHYAREALTDIEFDCILTSEEFLLFTGVLASELDVKVAFASSERLCAEKVYEAIFYPRIFAEAKIMFDSYARTLYLPVDSIRKNERVLVVDCFIDTGESIRALVGFARKAEASIAGIFCLGIFDLGVIEKLQEELGTSIRYLTILERGSPVNQSSKR